MRKPEARRDSENFLRDAVYKIEIQVSYYGAKIAQFLVQNLFFFSTFWPTRERAGQSVE
jgi:hypothetical protein